MGCPTHPRMLQSLECGTARAASTQGQEQSDTRVKFPPGSKFKYPVNVNPQRVLQQWEPQRTPGGAMLGVPEVADGGDTLGSHLP